MTKMHASMLFLASINNGGTFDLVKHDQYISQAVDGKQSNKEMMFQLMMCSQHLKIVFNSSSLKL